MTVSPILRQLLVAASPLAAALSVGGSVAYPTILLNQLKANDTSIHLDFETSTWIGSIHGLAGIPSIFMPTLMQWKGRKFAFITACLASLLGWILAYFAESPALILTSESFHGFGGNCIYSVSSLSITEMINPKYRDNVNQMYFVFVLIAMAAEGLLIQFVSTKIICIIMLIPMLIAIVTASMWPESPYWLAYKGKLSKCETEFNWLRGTDALSRKELNDILTNHKSNGCYDNNSGFKNYWKKITSRDFYLPCLHILVMEYLIQGMGVLATTIYSTDIVKRATGNDQLSRYAVFTINILLLTGFFISISLTKYFKKNTFILCSTIGAVVSSILIAFITYLQSIGVLSIGVYVFVFILTFVFSVSIGVMPVAHSVSAALMPVKHRGIGGIIYVLTLCTSHTFALKVTPYIMLYYNVWGLYSVFAVNGVIFGIFVWKFLPEIKDRTLPEIEYFYKYGHFQKHSRIDCSEHAVLSEDSNLK